MQDAARDTPPCAVRPLVHCIRIVSSITAAARTAQFHWGELYSRMSSDRRHRHRLCRHYLLIMRCKHLVLTLNSVFCSTADAVATFFSSLPHTTITLYTI